MDTTYTILKYDLSCSNDIQFKSINVSVNLVYFRCRDVAGQLLWQSPSLQELVLSALINVSHGSRFVCLLPKDF